MTIYGGKNLRLMASKEANWGVDSGFSNLKSVGMLQGEPAFSADGQLVPVYGGGMVNARHILEGSMQVGARFDYFLQDNFMAALSIGDYDSTSPVTNTANYIHYATTEDSTSTDTAPVEYKVGSSGTSYTLYYGIGVANRNEVLLGCATNSYTLTMALNEPIRASVEAFAKTITSNTNTPVVAALADSPLMYFNKGTVNFGPSGSTESNTEVSNLTVTVNNNLQRVYGADGTRTIQGLLQGNRNITGTVTLNYDGNDKELKNSLGLMSGGSYTNDSGVIVSSGTMSMDIDVLLDNNTTTTAAGYRGLVIDIRNFKLGTLERTHPVEGNTIAETYNFTARMLDIKYYDNNSSDPF